MSDKIFDNFIYFNQYTYKGTTHIPLVSGTPVGRASDSMMAPTQRCSFKLVGAGASCLLLGPPRFNWCFSFAPGFSKLFGAQGQLTESVESSFFIHRDLFVCP